MCRHDPGGDTSCPWSAVPREGLVGRRTPELQRAAAEEPRRVVVTPPRTDSSSVWGFGGYNAPFASFCSVTFRSTLNTSQNALGRQLPVL